MAEEAQERVQTGIKNFVNDVDKSHLRPMEKKMHLCAADCCSDPKASIDEVHRCVERCQVGTKVTYKEVLTREFVIVNAQLNFSALCSWKIQLSVHRSTTVLGVTTALYVTVI